MARAKKHASDDAEKAEVAPEAAPEAAPAGSETPTKVAKGDIAWIDYEGWILNPNGTRTLFDTTRAELAEKEGKFDEKKVYAEFPVVVGHGRLIPGLDEALLGAEIGKPQEVKISPEKGAGERDPKLVELHPLREFLKQEIHPEVGMEVSFGGRKGTITQVTGGRVRIDYNSPLAGRALQYSFTLTKKAETPEERLRAILETDYGLSQNFDVTIRGEEVDVVLPDICKTDERWFVSKFRVIADIRELLGFEKVRFVEEYTKPPPKPEPAKEEKPVEAKPPEETPKEAPKEERREEPKPTPEEERAEEELPPEEKTPEEL